MFGWGIYDFLAGVYAKKLGSFRTFFWSQLAGLVSLCVMAPFFLAIPDTKTSVLLLLPVASLFYACGYLFFMRGFEVGNISIVAAIMNLWAVFTMTIAFLFMGQRLTSLQFAGVILIISGAVLASINWREIRISGLKFSAGVKETLVGSFFFGAFWNVSEVISEEAGWLFTTLFVKLGIILILLLLSLLASRGIRLQSLPAKTKVVVLLMGLLDAGAVAAVNFGLTLGDAILITPIASALSVVTIILAIIFLKERITPIQGLGIMTAVSGIILTGV